LKAIGPVTIRSANALTVKTAPAEAAGIDFVIQSYSMKRQWNTAEHHNLTGPVDVRLTLQARNVKGG
jgi:hypothetical protein